MASQIVCRNLASVVVIFFCVLIAKGVHTLEDLDFTEEPSGAFVLRKQAVTLDCGAQGLQPLTIQWLRNGQAINPNEDHQVLNNGSLFMPSVVPKRDSAEYKCCASNEVGRICSCPATVLVANVPKYVISQQPDVVRRGGVLKLECISKDYPVTGVIWRLGKEVIAEDERRTILPNGVLQVSKVLTEDAGNYRCLTEHIGDGRIKSPVHAVNVMDSTDDLTPVSRDPEIVIPPQPQRLREGETALFECLADGDSLRVTWSRDDGQPIRSQDVNYLGGNNLQLLHVATDDAALYRCTVENTETGVSVEATAELAVLVPPTFSETPDNFYGPRGSTARFSCTAQGNPPPTIDWLHKGDSLTFDNRIVNQQPWGDLVFIGVWHEDMGTVQCVAKNEAGSIQAVARLKVKIVGTPPDPPKIRLMPISPSTVMITWDNPVNTGTGVVAYTIHYQAVGEKQQHQKAETELATRDMITDLKPHTNYSFYMLTWDRNGPSDESKRHYVLTDESTPSLAPQFSAHSNTPTTITLNWRPVPLGYQHGVITKYRIMVRESGEEPWDVNVNNASLTEYRLQNLLAGTIYQVRMAAGTDKGFGVNSDWVTVQTRVVSDPLPPAPLFDLWKLNQTSLSLIVAPLPPSEINLQGFKLFCSVYIYDRGVGAPETTVDPILLPLNTTEYVINGLEPKTTYVIKLLLYTAIGDGHETIQDITMGPEPDEPIQYLEAPTNLALESLGSRAVRLRWHAPVTTQLIVSYEVRYWPQGNESQNVLPIELDLERNNTISEVIIEGLDPFTMYEFDIRAVSTKTAGLFCEPRAVRTLEDRPSTPPKDILAKPLDPHAVKLQWEPPMEPNGVITHYLILFDQDVDKPEETWNQQARNGTYHQSTVEGLASNTKYYFKVRAGTQVGEGPPTDAVAAQTLIAERQGLTIHPWQEGLLIGACSAFVLIALVIFVVICSRRGLFKNGHSNASSPNDDSIVCTGYTTNGSGQDTRMYVMGSVEGGEQNGFTAMAALPQPRNLDTKGGTPLIINGNGPVRHHHHYPNGGGIPSRFPRSPGPCSADPDNSSQALLPGSESVTNSDLGEDNSQGKSEASSSSSGFCPYAQDVNHRKTVAQNGGVKTTLPPCSACCMGPQQSDSSTGSYGEPVPNPGVNQTPVSPTQPKSPHSQSQGLRAAAVAANNTGVNGGGGRGDDVIGGYYSDGRVPDASPTHQSRNELTWPRHTGRVLGRATPSHCETTPSIWERRTPDVATNCQGAEADLPRNISPTEHAQSGPSVEGEDTSPDFLSRVLDEFSSGTCSTTV